MLITLDNTHEVFRPFQYHGTLSPSAAATLNIRLMELLSEDHCDARFLKLISRFLTREAYDELITERNISMKCGYPLCSQSQARVRDVYSDRSRVAKSMLPYSYLSAYCSKRHYQCSEFYASQLSDEAIFARDNIGSAPYGTLTKYESSIKLLEDVLTAYAKDNDATMLDLIKNLDSLDIKKGGSKDELMDGMNRMLGDFKIVEHEVVETPIEPSDTLDGLTGTEKYEYLQDQSKAIDGYILR